MSKETTVIIPTMNRSKFLNNCFKYYVHNNFKGQFIILDSSSTKEVLKTTSVIDKFKSFFKIHYFHKVDHPTQIIKHFANKIQTKYSIVACDDDFYCVDTIIFLEDYLNKNPTIKVVNGKALRMDILQNNVLVSDYYIHNKCNDSDPYNRLCDYLLNYGPIIQSCLIETKLLIEICKFIPSGKDLNKCPIRIISDELLMGSIMVLSSKVVQLDKLILIRTIHGNNSNLSRSHTNNEIILSTNFFLNSVNKFSKNKINYSLDTRQLKKLKEYLSVFFLKPLTFKQKIIRNNSKIRLYLKKILFKFYYVRIFYSSKKYNNSLSNYLTDKKKFYKEIEVASKFIS